MKPKNQELATRLRPPAFNKAHMPLRNANAHRQLKLANALGFAGGLQSISKAWTGDFHCGIESQLRVFSITCDVIALIQGSAQTGRSLKGNLVNKRLLILALIALGGITAVALWQDGLAGIFAATAHSYGSTQIFADLVIALTLVMVWMWRDAKRIGRNAWFWIFITLAAGSFGPLLYLITRKEDA